MSQVAWLDFNLKLLYSCSAKSLANFTNLKVLHDLQEIQEAKEAGADVIELRLDYLKDLNAEAPEEGLKKLIDTSKAVGLPAIVTLRPVWEG